ncbi:MAG: hypothetical protein U5K00_04900 [Melioribacteraceae bacterium]|nr:hypothetical protein [Melioribacteraceae bacterium]
MINKIKIEIFGMPIAGCAEDKTWRAASEMVFKKLKEKFDSQIDTKYIELYSPESFQYEKINKLLENDSQKPPYIFINDEMFDSGGKISERIIREEIEKIVNNKNK